MWFKLAPISPDTLSRAASRATPVKGWLVASRYSLGRRTRLAAPSSTSRKDASHRLLQPTSRYEHPYGSFDSRSCLPRALASPLRDTSRLRLWRRLDPGGASLDGDPPASAVVMTLRGLANGAVEASCLAWRWRRPVLAGAAIDSPSERRRPTTVLSTASRARDSTSDALCRAQLLPRKLARFPLRARPAFSVASSKPPVRSDQSAFHRRMLPCGNPPPFSRLRRREAASGARSRLVHARFPRGCPEARPDASPRGPSSVRRLLQPKLTREHALRILRSLEVIRPVARALTLSGGVAPCLRQVRRSSASRRDSSRGFSGQGPRMAFASPAPLVAIAREESFAPTRWTRTPRVVES